MRGWGAVLCAIWCIASFVIVGVRSQDARAFDTDIQNLLPQSAIEPVIRAAIADAGSNASRRVAILVSGADNAKVEAAANDLERSLTEAAHFTADRAQGQTLGAWLYANRNALMCETDPARFDANAVVGRSNALLYAPIAPVSGELLQHDPFLLTLQLAQCLAPPTGGHIGNSVLVSGSLEGSAFRLDVQNNVTAAYDAWRTRHPDVHGARAGAVFYAADGAQAANAEITFIAGASTIAILVLLLICFRRWQAVVGTLVVTAVGGSGSLAAAMLIFPHVHVLVFVFGSALIGVTSDYALHYLATGPQSGWAPMEERLKRVGRPLAVCALATSLGFASLAVFGVSLFDQVAVFSVAGIITAWWFTVTLLPLMDRKARDAEKLGRWWDKLEAPFTAFKWTKLHTAGSVVLVLGLCVLAIVRFGVLDDVRQFQPRSPELQREEAQVREALGFGAAPTFLLSYGANAEQARQREEAAMAHWPAPVAHDALAATRFDPSAVRRAQNEAIIRRDLYDSRLAARVTELGLTDVNPFAAPATPPDRPAIISSLEGAAGGIHYLVAPLGSTAAGQATARGQGSMIVDPAVRYTRAFSSFRVLAAWAVAGAFAAVAVIVLLLYRTWRSLVVLIAPGLGVLLAVALPLAMGVPVSFFSVAALFVVIGAGIDHSVFLFEAQETDGQSKELVVFLAALTTILSMGLLGFSSTYPVRSFGLAVSAGVTAAYLFSFYPIRIRGRKTRANHQN